MRNLCERRSLSKQRWWCAWQTIQNNEISKPALSLLQSIQYNIDGKPNQTTLGTGIKLHHRHGSRDLIDDLHSHGWVADYYEILRFRKSCAKFTRDNPNLLHRLAGLSKEVVVIFGWYDNVDMFLSTPNGRRETHIMSNQFQAHPAGIIEAGQAKAQLSSLVIPRLTYTQMKAKDVKPAIQLKHYT